MPNELVEILWRVLTNPTDLQVSSTYDTNLRNFGLLQRQRDFHAYEDLESHFEKKPSLRVELRRFESYFSHHLGFSVISLPLSPTNGIVRRSSFGRAECWRSCIRRE